ncbi:cyclodeaminase/cyclohydrolase family protein [Adlercreutzia sp. ZJ138]|uniref:cyclodeaminase/cyclohydrolase family protein n=1 Tax=Adlercreutzia sp. ZJ138 TaxID=2709405 RepID=UPI0013EDEA7D|nr:cyclodeaminase/cyclohydrolase family protein [Adlercreutzia sp. ZJ138]
MVDMRFLNNLASADPTPGGGGAAAYCGALAAALASMVGNLTVGKKTYAAVEHDVQAALARLDDLRARLIALIDEDARAFTPLAAAYRMPKDTPEQAAAKDDALQCALILACEIPLLIMENVALVVDEIDFLAHNGSKMARSDAGVAATFARAALEGASLNVFINVASMRDEARAQQYRSQAECVLSSVVPRCDELFAFVRGEVS